MYTHRDIFPRHGSRLPPSRHHTHGSFGTSCNLYEDTHVNVACLSRSSTCYYCAAELVHTEHSSEFVCVHTSQRHRMLLDSSRKARFLSSLSSARKPGARSRGMEMATCSQYHMPPACSEGRGAAVGGRGAQVSGPAFEGLVYPPTSLSSAPGVRAPCWRRTATGTLSGTCREWGRRRWRRRLLDGTPLPVRGVLDGLRCRGGRRRAHPEARGAGQLVEHARPYRDPSAACVSRTPWRSTPCGWACAVARWKRRLLLLPLLLLRRCPCQRQATGLPRRHWRPGSSRGTRRRGSGGAAAGSGATAR